MFSRKEMILLAAFVVVAIISQVESATDKNGFDCSRIRFHASKKMDMGPGGTMWDMTNYHDRKEFLDSTKSDCAGCCKEANFKYGVLEGVSVKECECTNSLTKKIVDFIQ